MTISQTIIQELIVEAAVTRKYLAVVPFDKLDYQPTEKSEKLGRQAVHIAEIVAWFTSVAKTNRLDFENFEPKALQTKEELLNYFDTLLEEAIQSLTNAKDELFAENWSMTYGEETFFTLPKKQVARIFCMNHLVHHRAQLGVYLRLLDVAVPATYGPSADDEDVLLTQPF
jgi:uncharacterized damage-inducible protein DinB